MQYQVHSAHRRHIEVHATDASGEPVTGLLDVLEVELVPAEPWAKTFTHHVKRPDAGALAMFRPGNVIELGEFKKVEK